MDTGRDTQGPTVIKLKICLVGDPAVGKTSLVRRYVRDQFDDEYLETLGAKIAKKTLMIPVDEGQIQVDLILWDISGVGGWDSDLTRDYLTGTQGILAVCDATNNNTLRGMADWVEAIQRLTGDVPMQIVINKSDASEDGIPGPPLNPEGSTSCIRASAKTGNNVERAFHELASRVVNERLAKAHPETALELRPQA